MSKLKHYTARSAHIGGAPHGAAGRFKNLRKLCKKCNDVTPHTTEHDGGVVDLFCSVCETITGSVAASGYSLERAKREAELAKPEISNSAWA